MYLAIERDNFETMEVYAADIYKIYDEYLGLYQLRQIIDSKDALKQGVRAVIKKISELEEETSQGISISPEYIKNAFSYLKEYEFGDDSALDGIEDILSDVVGDIYKQYDC